MTETDMISVATKTLSTKKVFYEPLNSWLEPIEISCNLSAMQGIVDNTDNLRRMGKLEPTHYASLSYSDFVTVQNMIKESFASFMGWYNAKQYYSSCVYSDYAFRYITTQHRQDWTDNFDNGYSPYTPVYVDMLDSLNQYYWGGSRVIDNISSITAQNIIDFAIGPQNWNEVYADMYNAAGNLYDVLDFYDFTDKYVCFYSF